jgi:hypothetical protein
MSILNDAQTLGNAPTEINGFAVHPDANLFPMMSDAEIDALAADIAANGLQSVIVLLKGAILDGRNRVEACRRIGFKLEEWHFIEAAYTKAEARAFAVSVNLHRRHLTDTQRSLIAAKIAPKKRGRPPKNKAADLPISEPQQLTQSEAAKLLSVSPRSVRNAQKVLDDGIPELVKAIEDDLISVDAAAAIASLPKAEQKAALDLGPSAVKAKAKEVRAAKKPKPEKPKRTAEEIIGRISSELAAFRETGSTAHQKFMLGERLRDALIWLLPGIAVIDRDAIMDKLITEGA